MKAHTVTLLLGVVAIAAAVPIRRSESIRIEATDAAKADQVVDLPGLPAEASGMKQYAGYLPVHGGDRQIFYWFIEADTNPGELVQFCASGSFDL